MGLFHRSDTSSGGRTIVRERGPDGTTVTRIEDSPPPPPPPPPTETRIVEHRVERIEPVTTRVAAPGAYEVRPAIGSLTARILLTLAGAVVMIGSAFLSWFEGATPIAGTNLTNHALSPVGALGAPQVGFVMSAGMIAIVLGGLALLGLAPRTGGLTRIAGALGVVAFAMYGIRLYRTAHGDLPAAIGMGAWLLLAGSLVALVGGFMGTARRVVVPEETEVVTGHRTVIEPD